MRGDSLVLGSLRELGTIGVVAGLSGGYAAVLLMLASMLSAQSLGAQSVGTQGASGGAIGVLLGTVASVFIAIALYVAAVVITGCVATVIAGRLAQIALLRLLGADTRTLRRSICAGTAKVGFLGATIGMLVGTLAADLARIVLVRRGTIPDLDYPWATMQLVLPVLAVTACAAAAGWIGSRSVLHVSPVQAATNVAVGTAAGGTSALRAVSSLGMIVLGSAGLGLAMWLGERGSGAGFMLAFVASALSATGVLVGARFVIPFVVTTCGRVLGGSPSSVVARRNAVTDPMRTTRSTLGLVVGVGLITTFAAGTSALRTSLTRWQGITPEQARLADGVMSMVSTIMICVVVISCIIAAVGFVSTMSLTVIQRRREIGLLRALGFTAGQVRAMITKESVALSATAVLFGVALGIVYGSAGAQALDRRPDSRLRLGPAVAGAGRHRGGRCRARAARLTTTRAPGPPGSPGGRAPCRVSTTRLAARPYGAVALRRYDGAPPGGALS